VFKGILLFYKISLDNSRKSLKIRLGEKTNRKLIMAKDNFCEINYRYYTPANLIAAARASLDNIIRLMHISTRENGCDTIPEEVMTVMGNLETELQLYEFYINRNMDYMNPGRAADIRKSLESFLELIDEILCFEQGKIITYVKAASLTAQALGKAQDRTQAPLTELSSAFNDVEGFLRQQFSKQHTCQLDTNIAIMQNFHVYFDSLPAPAVTSPKPALDPMSVAIGAVSSGATLLLVYLLIARRNPIISGCYNLGTRLGIFRPRDKEIADPSERVGLTSSRVEMELAQQCYSR
jgi:hypothetical protein